MKNLKDILTEGILDDIEINIAKGDKLVDDPFKFLANLSFETCHDKTQWEEAIKIFETIVAANSKELDDSKKTSYAKYKIGIKHATQFDMSKIYVKCDGMTNRYDNSSSHIPIDKYFIHKRFAKKVFQYSDKVYVPSNKLMEQYKEFAKYFMGFADNTIYADEWAAWEKYKKS